MIPRAPGPKAPMTRRTRGREIALQVLYQLEQNPGQGPDEVSQFILRRLREPKLCAFAHALVAGVLEHQPRIDALISDVAENWRLDRMAAIDRNILRLGAYELLYCDDVPTKVAINEALELAKRYSTAQSSRFVNGILDRLQAAGSAQLAKQAAEATKLEESEEPAGAGPNPGVEAPSSVEEVTRATTELETEGVGGLAVDPTSSHEPLTEPEASAQPPTLDEP
jgi:transcription antitermination protein NusB